jgi:hypothetical protein
MIATLHQCAYHDTLQAIGWFDGLVFTAPVNDTLRPLLDAAAEKYGCDGAELLERMAVDCLVVRDVDVR